MELSLLLQVYAWNCYGSLAIGLVLNFLLLFVAKKCPTSGLREYRRVVFYFFFLNVSFLFVHAFNQPLIYSASNNLMYMLLSGPITQFTSSPALWRISDIMNLVLMNQCLAGLAMQFVDRYMVICRNHQNRFGRKLVLGCLLCLFSGFSITGEFLAIPKDENLQLVDLKEPIFSGAENVIKNIKIENPILTCAFIGLFSSTIFLYVATIFCYLRIKEFLKANMQTDVVHGVKRKTLKNIIWSMLIQAFVPLYSLGLIGVVIGISLVAHVAIFGQYLLVVYGVLNWIALLNPLVTLLTIDDYRRDTIALFRFRGQKSQTPTILFVKSHNT